MAGAHERRRSPATAPQSGLQAPDYPRGQRQKYPGLRQRALQKRHPAHQEHRAAETDHHESLLLHRHAPRGFPGTGNRYLKPMMIKEVAEEIGVHPSTVSRAVANKYVHTPQGVFELRYFFSESVQGPEGGGTSLLILKRRVKKLIEEEDPSRPLTDEQITRILQSQGIQVTRRTVAKYREDMRIPSTHQRRVKK